MFVKFLERACTEAAISELLFSHLQSLLLYHKLDVAVSVAGSWDLQPELEVKCQAIRHG